MKHFGCIKSKLDGSEIKYNTQASLTLPQQYSYIGLLSKVFDQGDKNDCVVCSISSIAEYNNTIYTIKEIESLYKELPHTKDGMEIKVVLEHIKKHPIKGLKINSFGMVGSMIMLKYALITNGICIGALPVYNEDNEDFWNGSTLKGGHCVAIVGWNANGFLIRNSWGSKYGENGYGCISYDDFKKFYEIWTIIN